MTVSLPVDLTPVTMVPVMTWLVDIPVFVHLTLALLGQRKSFNQKIGNQANTPFSHKS